MTLDEAIKHAEEVADELDNDALCAYAKAEDGTNELYVIEGDRCSECAEEHRQLAEWLKDYKRLKKQEPCDVPDINDGNIYKCPCGYEWDKSKVVRYHFCPNCGRAVNSSYNSIKPELKSCEDAISRQDAIKKVSEILKGIFVEYEDIAQKAIGSLPYVTPQPQPQPKRGHWILYDHGLDAKYYQCSICKGFDRGEKGRYCKWCGAKMIEPQESEGEK